MMEHRQTFQPVVGGPSGSTSSRVRQENRQNVDTRRCHHCDCKMIKETGKSRSRVWRKVMWFTKKSKNSKLDYCQCEDVELGNSCHSSHSNSWSFARSASKKFRISSRRRRCKSENVRKSFHGQEMSGKARTENRGAPRPSRTATGNFCDFGTSSRNSLRNAGKCSNASVLTGIARELNPPANTSMQEVDYLSGNRLSKVHSSASFNCTANTLGRPNPFDEKGVRRCQSFPGPLYNTCHSKRKKQELNHKSLNHKCHSLRRTATFNGKLNCEYSRTPIQKSMSDSNGDFLKKGSTSLGEIQDQDGSIIGIVHFYKSPKSSCIRQMSSFSYGFKTLEAAKSNSFCEYFNSQNDDESDDSNCITFSRPFHSSYFYNSGIKDIQKAVHMQQAEPNCPALSRCFHSSPYLCLNKESYSSSSNLLPKETSINTIDLHFPSHPEGIYFQTSSPLPQHSQMSICNKKVCKEKDSAALTNVSPTAKTFATSNQSHRAGTSASELKVGTSVCNDCKESNPNRATDLVCIPDASISLCQIKDEENELIIEPLSKNKCKDKHSCDIYADNIARKQSSFHQAQQSFEANLKAGGLHENGSNLCVDVFPGNTIMGENNVVKHHNSTKTVNRVLNGCCECSNEPTSRNVDNINDVVIDKLTTPKGKCFTIDDQTTLPDQDIMLRSKESSKGPGSLGQVQHFDVPPELNRGGNINVEMWFEAPCLSLYDQDKLIEWTDKDVKHTFLGNQKQVVPAISELITTEKMVGGEFYLQSAVESNYVWHEVTLEEEVKEESLQYVVCNIETTDVACITNTVQVLESSSTSDYASCSDEDLSNQNDISINMWKTLNQSALKDDGLRPPVPGNVFKMRTELMLSWFEEFNDEQKNIIIKKLLDHCELPQMHLLSVAMEPNLHKSCPPNCQDMLVWLPYPVTLKILLYLDAVSLCHCNQVNRAWNELTNNQLLWQHLTRNPDYQLSEASSVKQLQKYTQPNGTIHWKKVLAERFLLQKNWLNGKYTLKTFNGHSQGIACVQFDDTRIVSGSSDKTIKLWNISNSTSELMLTLAGHSGTVRCLDLNGNRLVSGSTDRTIKVWDLSFASYWAGASCKVTMVGHLHTVRCLQADEKKLVSGSYDKTVKVWNLKTGQCQLTLRGHTAAVLCVQFDDQKIVSGSYDKKIKVWDLNEGSCLMTLDGHHDAVTCLNLTHDGMKIITGSLDYSLKFWDLYTGKCYGTLDWITSEGHTAVVRCLQVDSWRIISGGDDKTLKVWELATGQRLLTLRYHSDGVTCMQFNDFAIVSGSYDRTVKLWDFTPKHPYLESVT